MAKKRKVKMTRKRRSKAAKRGARTKSWKAKRGYSW